MSDVELPDLGKKYRWRVERDGGFYGVDRNFILLLEKRYRFTWHTETYAVICREDDEVSSENILGAAETIMDHKKKRDRDESYIGTYPPKTLGGVK